MKSCNKNIEFVELKAISFTKEGSNYLVFDQEILLFITFCLLIGLILFSCRDVFSKITSKIGGIIRKYIMTRLLFKIPHFESNFEDGFFLVYWTLTWLVCRFTLIQPIYSHLILILGNETLFIKALVRFGAILLALIIALIPATFLTSYQKLNDYISVFHYIGYTQDPWYIRFALRLHVFWSNVFFSNMRMRVMFLFIFTLFIGYLLSANKVILVIFLLLLYSKLYYQNFTLRIMPGLAKIEKWNSDIPVLYFLANVRYRYLENKFPVLLGGKTFDESPFYSFKAITKEDFDILGLYFKQILFVDYLNDSSIISKEKSKMYKKLIPDANEKGNGIFLERINEELSSLPLISKDKLKNGFQKRSFHTTSRYLLPISEFGEAKLEKAEASKNPLGLDIEKVRIKELLESKPFIPVGEDGLQSTNIEGTMLVESYWEKNAQGFLMPKRESIQQIFPTSTAEDTPQINHEAKHD